MATMGGIAYFVLLLPVLQLGAAFSDGREFVLIYPEMKGYNGSVSLSPYVIGTGPMTLTVYESGSAATTTMLMTNGELSLVNNNIIVGDGISFKMVRLTSDKNVKIFGRYTAGDRGELYSAIPTTSLGSEYYVATYCEEAAHLCHIQIASLDVGTTVEVALTNGGNSDVTVEFLGVTYHGGDTITMTLNQYQVAHIESASDLTGTRISSNTNIVVYSGSSATTVRGAGEGFLLKPMSPVTTWGRVHVAVRTPGRIKTGDYFRIITSESNTVVTISGESPITLSNRGQWVQRNFSGSDEILVSSNKPVMVVRLSPGQREVTEPGVPTMVLVVPNEQFVTGTNVIVPKVPGLTSSIITVVTKKQYTGNMLVESNSVMNWFTVGSSNYVVAEVSVTSNYITVSSSPEARFAVYFHGHGSPSFAYTGGRNYANINPPCSPTVMSIGDEVDNDCNGQTDEDSCTLTDYVGKDCSVIVSGDRDVYGTRFVFVFPYHTPDPALTVAVYLSKPGVDVTLQTPNLPGQVNTTRTLSGTSHSFDVPYSFQVNGSSSSNNTLLLEASEEVSLMILSADPSPDYSGGAFRALPIDGLGREYIAATYCEDNMCFIDISAAHPDTVVTVLLKLVNKSHVVTYDGAEYVHGETIIISLAMYESAQVLCAVDMTGSKITATKPVAVITGGQFTRVMGLSNKDMVIEQLMPLQTLGRLAAVVQTPGRLSVCATCRDHIRIIASQDNTLVTFNMNGTSTPYFLTFEGMFQDIMLLDKGTIESDKPIMVMQLMVEFSIKIDGGMVLVIPVEQYSNEDHVFIPPTNVDTINLLVIANQSDTFNIFYNDNVFMNWENLPGTMMLATSSATFDKGVTNNITGSAESIIGGHIATRMALFAPGTFSFPLAFRLDAINQPCVLTPSVPGDSIDNDCDGLIDEENCTIGISDDGDYDGMFDEDCKEAAVASSSTMQASAISGAPVDHTVTSTEEYSSQPVIQSTSEDIATITFLNPPASSAGHLVSSTSSEGIATPTFVNQSASSVEHVVSSTSPEGIATPTFVNPPASSVEHLGLYTSSEGIATATFVNQSASSVEHLGLYTSSEGIATPTFVNPPASSVEHLGLYTSSEGIATATFVNQSASSVEHLVSSTSSEGIATPTFVNPPASSLEHLVLSSFIYPSTTSIDMVPPISSLGSSPSESPVHHKTSSVDVSMLKSPPTFLSDASAQIDTSSIILSSTETQESSEANTALTASTPFVSQPQQTIEERCTCKCSPWKTNIASESLTRVVESIKKELTVDKDTVSQAIRKKTSAPDHRQSAVSMGYVGIAVILSLFVGIFVLDAGSLYRDLLSLFKTLKDNCSVGISKQAT